MRLRAGAAGSRRVCVRGLRPGNPPGNHMPSRSLETPIGISERIPSGGWETSRVRNTSIGERAHVRVSSRAARVQAAAREITSANYHNARALGHRKAGRSNCNPERRWVRYEHPADTPIAQPGPTKIQEIT